MSNGKWARFMGQVALMVSLMLLRISPVCMILRNWFSVVAWWNRAIFSLTKKVSGTQISLMYSAPTTVTQIFTFCQTNEAINREINNKIIIKRNFPNFSSSCFWKANLKTFINLNLTITHYTSYLGSVQNCLKYISKVKSMNFSERSPMERM